jgi:hypothetical protein
MSVIGDDAHRRAGPVTSSAQSGARGWQAGCVPVVVSAGLGLGGGRDRSSLRILPSNFLVCHHVFLSVLAARHSPPAAEMYEGQLVPRFGVVSSMACKFFPRWAISTADRNPAAARPGTGGVGPPCAGPTPLPGWPGARCAQSRAKCARPAYQGSARVMGSALRYTAPLPSHRRTGCWHYLERQTRRTASAAGSVPVACRRKSRRRCR